MDVPEAPESGETYLGFVAYDRFELRIFVNKYELWDTSGTPTLIDSALATTAGRRNIGIRAGIDAGVWVDGSHLLGGPTTILPRPQVRFGTHWIGPADDAPGLVLLENLCYVRSWLRSVSTEESIPTGPRVTTTFFDGPRPVTVREPITTNTSPAVVNFTEDATRADHTDGGGDSVDTITLPNGRRTTGQVIRPYADGIGYEGGTPVTLEDAVPGVSIRIAVDAVGTTQNQVHIDPWAPKNWCNFGYATTSSDFGALYGVSDIAMGFGPHGGPEGPLFGVISSNPGPTIAMYGSGLSTGDGMLINGDGRGGGGCICRCNDASVPTTANVYVSTSLGLTHNARSAYADVHVNVESSKPDEVIPQGSWVPATPEAMPDGSLRISIGSRVYEVAKDKWSSRNTKVENADGSTSESTHYDFNEADASLVGFRVSGKIFAIGDSTPRTVTQAEALDLISEALDWIGFIPGLGEIADGANVFLLSMQGKELEAALSAISLIPGFGDAIAKPIKLAFRKSKNFVEAAKSWGAVMWTALVEKLVKIAGDCADAGPVKSLAMKAANKLARVLGKYDIFVCFPAGTKVQTADGEENIEDIQPGELVWTYDEASGQWLLLPVATVSVNQFDGWLIVITLNTGEVIECTPEHPFYVRAGLDLATRDIGRHNPAFASTGPSRWVHAENLQSGDKLSSKDGTQIIISAVSTRRAKLTVYNLEVLGHHNYTVGALGILVHNACNRLLRENLKNSGLKATQSAKRMDWQKIDELAEEMRKGTFDWAKAKHADKIIVDQAGNIVGGHHRVIAAQKAGVEIPENAIYRMKGVTERPVYEWDDVVPDN